ncbi:hypothetical protein LCGC14_1450710 [marine sediment metagenome]|uniref:Uncharacterized protein n=1 Tax=marine sediment metagenome TaxID=412755 RepID=A0A0F9JHW5_9ZZZZ
MIKLKQFQKLIAQFYGLCTIDDLRIQIWIKMEILRYILENQ